MCPYMYICIRMCTENERGAKREKEVSEKESIIRGSRRGGCRGTGTEERGLKGVVATNSVTASPARPN